MVRILLLEDDASLSEGLHYAFRKQGYEVDCARTLAEARALWSAQSYTLLVLDVSLPDGSGFDFCRQVRSHSQVPIIFLTAADEEVSVVQGLDMGGDDYITKPFKLGILLSRVQALLRRSSKAQTQTELQSNGIRVLLLQGQVYKNGTLLELTAGEYRLLCLLMQNPDLILSKQQILARLWDSAGSFVDDNTLSVYIRRLRLKIEDDPQQPQKIVTVRGLGYKWSVKK